MSREDLAAPTAGDEDSRLIAALRAGDEQAFAGLVERFHRSMVRVARAYVSSKEAAEDVVQDAWLGVLQGLSRFEGRSSLKTWMFRIVINKAMTRGGRDARSVPFSSLGPDEPAVNPDRFHDSGRWAGHWAVPPSPASSPEAALLTHEARSWLETAIADLPANQRLVITLRDVQGFSAPETCDLLGVSEVNQRVLLHRARSKVRAALDEYEADRVGVQP
jgi:RNA polymerase sigma-70 factor, ECF subfamily